MTDLEWRSTLRYGPYLRGVLGASPVVVVVVALVGALLGLQLGTGTSRTGALGPVGSALLGALLGAVVVTAVLVAVLAGQLRRHVRTAGSREQHHRLRAGTLTTRLGETTTSVPLASLRVARQGRDHLVLRRGPGRGIPSVLLFDDPGLVPEVAARLRAASAPAGGPGTGP